MPKIAIAFNVSDDVSSDERANSLSLHVWADEQESTRATALAGRLIALEFLERTLNEMRLSVDLSAARAAGVGRSEIRNSGGLAVPVAP